MAVNFAIGWALFGVRMSLVPLFVTEGMDQRPVWIGVGFLCSSIAQVGFLVFAGRYVDRAGRKPAMVAGSLITAVALGLITFSTQLPVFLVVDGRARGRRRVRRDGSRVPSSAT